MDKVEIKIEVDEEIGAELEALANEQGIDVEDLCADIITNYIDDLEMELDYDDEDGLSMED